MARTGHGPAERPKTRLQSNLSAPARSNGSSQEDVQELPAKTPMLRTRGKRADEFSRQPVKRSREVTMCGCQPKRSEREPLEEAPRARNDPGTLAASGSRPNGHSSRPRLYAPEQVTSAERFVHVASNSMVQRPENTQGPQLLID